MTFGATNRPHTAVVCDYDPLFLPALSEHVRSAGFEVLGEATNVAVALKNSLHYEPSLIVVTNEHSGLTALEAVTDFCSQPHHPEVLVLSTSEVDRDHFLQRGALLLVGRFDNDGLGRALAEAKEYLTTGERRKRGDRRERGDRRQAQDWKMVTKERRVLADRRVGNRRQDSTTPNESGPAGAGAGILARAIERARAVADQPETSESTDDESTDVESTDVESTDDGSTDVESTG